MDKIIKDNKDCPYISRKLCKCILALDDSHYIEHKRDNKKYYNSYMKCYNNDEKVTYICFFTEYGSRFDVFKVAGFWFK